MAHKSYKLVQKQRQRKREIKTYNGRAGKIENQLNERIVRYRQLIGY